MIPIAFRTGAMKPKLVFRNPGDSERLSDFSKKFLEQLVSDTKSGHFEITSVCRTSAEQAEAMYNKLARGKVDRYRAAGTAVQKVGLAGLQEGHRRSTTLKAMKNEIDKLGLSNVTNHGGRFGLDVLDITANIKYLSEDAQKRIVNRLRRSHGCPVFKFGHAGGKKGDKFEFQDHDCIHIEIIQPDELSKLMSIA